ncbi:uncharacterized protein LOC128232795 [Mya arenaria]|uniref:uncharacterized protein LOC128232795 n=1 Tax=Mya arenaria TaxID=6604 RepID=UPI0022E64266|nr:uncharacterized protein LOC128232795 [Mya arenaria]
MNAKIALIVSSFACVLNTVGLAIPYWLYASASNSGVSEEIYFGLWKLCIKGQGSGQSISGCFGFDERGLDLPTVIITTRAVEIIAVGLMFSATLWAAVKIALKRTVLYTKISGIKCIIAGVLAIVGCVLFAINDDVKNLLKNGQQVHLHAGFALCIVAGIASLVAGVIYIIARPPEQQTGGAHSVYNKF